MGKIVEKVISTNTLDIATIGLGGLASVLFGTWVPMMTTLIVLNGVDFFTGFLKGGRNKNIGSRALSNGIKKKVGGWSYVVIGNVIDQLAFDGISAAKIAVLGYLIATEIVSITENAEELGYPVPPIIAKYLGQVKKNNEKEV